MKFEDLPNGEDFLIQYRDNSDGEGHVDWILARKFRNKLYSVDKGDELLMYRGDEVLDLMLIGKEQTVYSLIKVNYDHYRYESFIKSSLDLAELMNMCKPERIEVMFYSPEERILTEDEMISSGQPNEHFWICIDRSRRPRVTLEFEDDDEVE